MKNYTNIFLIALLFFSIFGVIDLGFNTNEVSASATNLISNSTFDSNINGWGLYSPVANWFWDSGTQSAKYSGGAHYSVIKYNATLSVSINPDNTQTLYYDASGVKNIFLRFCKTGVDAYPAFYMGDGTNSDYNIYNFPVEGLSGMTLSEIWNTYKPVALGDYDSMNFTIFGIQFMGQTDDAYIDNVYIWQADEKVGADGNPLCTSTYTMNHTLNETSGYVGDTITGSFYLEDSCDSGKEVLTSKSVKLNGVEVVADGDITDDGANTYSYEFNVPTGATSGDIIVYGTYGGTEYSDTGQAFAINVASSSGSNMYRIIADKDRIEVGQTVVLMLEHTTNGLLYSAETVTPKIQQLLDDAEVGIAFAPFVHDGSKYTATLQLYSKGKYTFTGEQIEYPVDVYVGVNPSDYVEHGKKCNIRIGLLIDGNIEDISDYPYVAWSVSVKDSMGIRHNGTVTVDPVLYTQSFVDKLWSFFDREAHKQMKWNVAWIEIPNVNSGTCEVSIAGRLYGISSSINKKNVINFSTLETKDVKCGDNKWVVSVNNQFVDNSCGTCPSGTVCENGICVPVTVKKLSCPECQDLYKRTYPDKQTKENISFSGISLPIEINVTTKYVPCKSDEREEGTVSIIRYVYQSVDDIVKSSPECGNCVVCQNVNPPDEPDTPPDKPDTNPFTDPRITNPDVIDPFNPDNPYYGQKGTLSVTGIDTKDGLNIIDGVHCGNLWSCDNKYSLTTIVYDTPIENQNQQKSVCSCNAQNGITVADIENIPVGNHRVELVWEKPVNGQNMIKKYNTYLFIKPNSEGKSEFTYDFKNLDFNNSNLKTLRIILKNSDTGIPTGANVKAKATKYSCNTIGNPEQCSQLRVIPETSFYAINNLNSITWNDIILEDGYWYFDITLNGVNKKFWYIITEKDFDRGYIEIDFAKCIQKIGLHVYNSKETDTEKSMKHSYSFWVANIEDKEFKLTTDKENGVFNADGEITWYIPEQSICIYDSFRVQISVTREDGTQWIQSAPVVINYVYSDDVVYNYDYGTGIFSCSGAGCGSVEVPPDDPNPPVVPVQEIKYYETWVKISVGDKCAIEKLQTHETEVDLWWTVNNATIHAPLFKNGQFYYKGQRVTETTLIDHIIISGMPIANYFVYNEYEQGGSVYLRYYNVGLPNRTINYKVRIDDYEKTGSFNNGEFISSWGAPTLVDATTKEKAYIITIPCGATGDFWAKILAFLESNGYAILILAIVSLIAGILLSLVVGRSGVLIGVLVFVIGVAFLWIAPSETITELNQYVKDFIGDL
ncbi:MAG: hypothetical protein M0R17_07135 [Candidatus Omnitrophica bacterium]|jgi:hypothetical protein|nr:hypothetical protein [Candidatus Omnitrophota bacterium]